MNYVCTPVVATDLATGEKFHFPSMSEAAIKGGFEIGRIQDCVQGFARTHVGFTFEATGPKRPARDRPRVREAHNLFRSGLTLQQVAAEMGISPSTAGKYVKQGAIKWGARNA